MALASDPIVPVLSGLAAVFLSAKVLGKAATRLKQPAVLGELVAGLLLGALPLAGIHSLEFIKTSEVFEIMAGIGVILLLFEVGLDTSVAEMRKVGVSAALVAILGVVAPLLMGYGVGVWLLPEHSFYAHLFLGATLCATSVGITARVFKDMGFLQSKEAQIILGAAVIDDVLGLIVLAVVQGMIAAASTTGQGGSIGMDVVVISAKAFGFLAVALVAGRQLTPFVFKLFARLKYEGVLLALGLVVCFLLASAAAAMGLAPIVGAFAAGLIIDGKGFASFFEDQEKSLEELMHPVSEFFVPLFFVTMGMKVDLTSFADPSVLTLGIVLCVVAFISKQVCGLVVVGGKGLSRALIGFGMVPRGEVGLIFAMIGSSLMLGEERIIDAKLYAAIVMMIMFTTMVTPITITWSLSRRKAAA